MKPLAAAGGFSVMRAEDPEQLAAASQTFHNLLPGYAAAAGVAAFPSAVLVEELLHGPEVSKVPTHEVQHLLHTLLCSILRPNPAEFHPGA